MAAQPPNNPYSVHIKDLVPVCLDNSNYMKWSHLFLPVLDIYELQHHIDGSSTAPPSIITDSTGNNIPISNSAHAAWAILKSHFVNITTAREMQIKYQLQSLKKGDLSIDAYMGKIKELADSLQAIDRVLTDSELLLYALNGLPPSYESFLHGVPASSSSTALVATNIPKAKVSSVIPSFSRGNGRSGRGGRNGGRWQNRGRGCGGRFSNFGRGYSAPVSNSTGSPSFMPCPTSVRGLLGPPPSQTSVIPSFVHPNPTQAQTQCQICKKFGHVALDCPHRHNYSYTSSDFSRQFAGFSLQYSPDRACYMDSGASSHMTYDQGKIKSPSMPSNSHSIFLGDGSTIPVSSIGCSTIVSPNRTFHLNSILHVPSLHKNLLSIKKFTKDNDCFIEFHSWGFFVKDLKTERLLLTCPSDSPIYPLVISSSKFSPSPSRFASSSVLFASRESIDTWHARLGHPGIAVLNFLLSSKFISFSRNNERQFYCPSCVASKHASLPFPALCPHTSQQNGVSERKHRHISEMGRTMLFHATAPHSLWVEAFSTAVFLINRLPSPALHNKSPYELVFHTPPNYSFFRPFGCLCFPNLQAYRCRKLASLSAACVFLGYSPNHKGYRCMHLTTKRVYISRRVRFIEHVFPLGCGSKDIPLVTPSSSHIFPAPIMDIDNHTSSFSTSPTTSSMPQSSTDTTNPSLTTIDSLPSNSSTSSLPSSSHSMITRSMVGTHKPNPKYALLTSHLESLPIEPTCFSSAIKDHKWRDAIVEEFNALLKNQTWTLVPYHLHMNVIGNKWVYRVKQKANGSLERYKARLVAKGYNQQKSIDFSETFSPVVRPSTIHLVISLALSRGWDLRQLDVKNAFLHGFLNEEVYMSQPQDDIIVTGSNITLLNRFIHILKSQFSMNDLGPLHYFLGIHVTKTSNGLHLSQRKYARDLLSRASLLGCKPVHSPTSGSRPSASEGDLLSDPSEYRSFVGALQYLTITRPDISFAVNTVSQFMSTPRTIHLIVVKRILRYLAGTISLGLYLKSTTGFAIFLGPNLISWSCKKQPTVSRSSTKAEYRALAHTVAELSWLQHLLRDLDIPLSDPPLVLCDNVSALYLYTNPIYHARTKHLEIDFYFIRELVAAGSILVRYISIDMQLADILTKGLSSHRLSVLRDKLHISPNPCSA
uniref:Retrovirus-related Pol polyprotein from transposon TNT 1-94 n=1 Tax=Nicotiana tabacum TaxID=4097 RepID=A0A1S4BKH3_TOBAC|nr:PREDICTED: uncharacterized protein LOC107809250 [Nicotiana tabacum]